MGFRISDVGFGVSDVGSRVKDLGPIEFRFWSCNG